MRENLSTCSTCRSCSVSKDGETPVDRERSSVPERTRTTALMIDVCSAACYCDGNMASFVMGLVNVVVAVLIVTTRVSTSFPGCICKTLASGHLHGGNLSSVSNANVPTLMLLFL
ncbi:hypothetical protein PV326_001352 [Microctonus aethiopoides]|nr:hypothetical protein PV326_001352 [Microctonus aethiopoides]